MSKKQRSKEKSLESQLKELKRPDDLGHQLEQLEELYRSADNNKTRQEYEAQIAKSIKIAEEWNILFDKIKKDLATAYNNHAVTKSNYGDLEGAVALYEEAIRLNPNEKLIHNNIEIAKNNLPKTNIGRYFRKKIHKLVDYDLIRGVLIGFVVTLMTFVGSVNYYGRKLERKLEVTKIRISADAKLIEGDLEGALTDINQAIALDSNEAFSYSCRGRIRDSKGDVEGAIADYAKAVELEPKEPIFNYELGRRYNQKGDLEKAKFYLKTAADLGDKDAKRLLLELKNK